MSLADGDMALVNSRYASRMMYPGPERAEPVNKGWDSPERCCAGDQ